MVKARVVLLVCSMYCCVQCIYPMLSKKPELRLSLEQIFKLADENSHQLKLSQIEIEKSENAVKAAKVNQLPTIETSLSVGYIGDQTLMSRKFADASSVLTPHWGNTLAIEINQPVYSGGAIKGAINLAGLKSQLAHLQHEQNKQELRFRLADWYLCLCRFSNEEKIYLSNKYQSEKLLEEMQARYEEGTALKSDVTRYRLRLKEIEMEIEQVQNRQSILNYYLLTVLGLPLDQVIIPDKASLEIDMEITEALRWQELTSLQSYRIRSAQKNESISRQQTDIIKAEKFPSVFLWTSESLKGPVITAMPPINRNLNVWQVGVGVRFSVSSLYTVNRKMRVQENIWQQSKENLRLTIDQEHMALNEAYTQWVESVNQLEIRKQYKELADENYEVISNRYLNGLAVITEMIDASNEQLSAELKLANKQIEIYYNYNKLKKLAGLL